MVRSYRNSLQHSRKKSLPDSSFLHRSDSSQPPYQPLEMPTGGKISLKTNCIHLEFAFFSGEIKSLSLWSMLGADTRSQREETQVIEMHQIPPPPMKVFNMSSSLFNPHHPPYHHDHNCHHQWRSWQARAKMGVWLSLSWFRILSAAWSDRREYSTVWRGEEKANMADTF